nr:hypothetical protein [Tanacetum cinerariifolium]
DEVNDPDAALELAKSISQTEAEEAKAICKVHATHARTVVECVSESAKKNSGGRSSKSVVIQDTLSTPKSNPPTSKTKLNGSSSLTPQEQEAVDIMQVLKESKKTSKRQPGTGGSNEGTGSKPGILNDSTNISATSSEQTGVKQRNDNDDKDGDADDEGNDHVSDTQDVDDEDDKIESDEDDIYKYKIRVRKDEDVEMKDVEVDDSNKDAALELAKSISQTEAEEAKAICKVHATHARTVVECVSESAKKNSGGRSSKSVVIQDTLSTPKSNPPTSKTKLNGSSSLTPQEQEAVDIMQVLKESKKTSKRREKEREKE